MVQQGGLEPPTSVIPHSVLFSSHFWMEIKRYPLNYCGMLWYPGRDLNPHDNLRRVASYPLDDLGVNGADDGNRTRLILRGGQAPRR